MMAFFSEVQGYLKERANDDALNPYLKPLGQALAHLQQATMWFMQNAMAKPENGGAGATDYMHLFGLVALGYMWCRMVEAARGKLAAGANGAEPSLNAKLVAGRFFMERMLPETALASGADPGGGRGVMELPADAF